MDAIMRKSILLLLFLAVQTVLHSEVYYPEGNQMDGNQA